MEVKRRRPPCKKRVEQLKRPARLARKSRPFTVCRLSGGRGAVARPPLSPDSIGRDPAECACGAEGMNADISAWDRDINRSGIRIPRPGDMNLIVLLTATIETECDLLSPPRVTDRSHPWGQRITICLPCGHSASC